MLKNSYTCDILLENGEPCGNEAMTMTTKTPMTNATVPIKIGVGKNTYDICEKHARLPLVELLRHIENAEENK